MLVVARQQQLIEKALEPQGITVNWVEFQAGPPLLEALNVGSIDFGYTGDSPPIFSQAAGGNLVYVAAIPSKGIGSAIVVPKDSPIKTLADLKGKTVGFTKGSSAHNVIVAGLEKAGLTYADITPPISRPPTPAPPSPPAPSTPGASGIPSTPTSRRPRAPASSPTARRSSASPTASSWPTAPSPRTTRTS